MSKQHWSQKKGVVSGKQAQQHARAKHRAHEFKQARKGKGSAPGYQETAAGCPLALVMLPILIIRGLIRALTQ